MKTVGEMKDGGLLVEMSQEEHCAVLELARLSRVFAPGVAASAVVPVAVVPSTAPRPRGNFRLKAQVEQKTATPSGKKSRDKNCITCGHAFHDDSKTNVRTRCATCNQDKKAITAAYQAKWALKKKSTMAPAAAPQGSAQAAPKKSRLEMIRAADERVKARLAREQDPVLDRPTDNGRVLPVGGAE